MGNHLTDIPEVRALDSQRSLIRIPPELDIPITPRVLRLVDSASFRRLGQISQLGLVSGVYPGAVHSRFEHSLGVYRNSLEYLKKLSQDDRFVSLVSSRDAEQFIVAALLHDLGHWPFCHLLEDMGVGDVPRHEKLADVFLEGELADQLQGDWQLDPSEISTLLSGHSPTERPPLLASMLSGPIDVDKLDYLRRDSLHAGVPYGMNFDRSRLIGSLCLNASGDALALSDKGRTAAEMMVFARYVMFSEVYWHHTVRSATAMLQRAFLLLTDRLDLTTLFRQTEAEMRAALLAASQHSAAMPLVTGLFGPQRRYYKRLAQFSLFQQPEIYRRLAQRPYSWLAECATALARELSQETGQSVRPEQVLVDAPPVKREVEIKIDVHFPKEDCYRSLASVSPVVQTLAREQFDDYVKRVRIYVDPDVRDRARAVSDLPRVLHRAIDSLPSSCGGS